LTTSLILGNNFRIWMSLSD